MSLASKVWRGAVLAALTAGCVYDPDVPDGVALCGDTSECPGGYACRVKPGTADMKVCCKTASCGVAGGGESDGAADGSSPDGGRGIVADLAADQPLGVPDAGADAAIVEDHPAPSPDLPPAPRDAAFDLAPDSLVPDAVPDSGGASCPPATRGPALVRAGSYCIDSTEVTNAQYAAFLAAKGSDVSGQPSACQWNASYFPIREEVDWPYAAGTGNNPVVNIDWCDAYMFCAWANKRLCGRVGGGRISSVSAATTLTGQWLNACTGGGRFSYPYGNTFNKSTCNTDAPNELPGHIEEVKHRPGCQGGYPDLWDMSGNVEEWLDACDANAASSDSCAVAGNTLWISNMSASDVTCTSSIFGTPRNMKYHLLGFRCCAE
jgi:hypothetical protein